MPCAYAAVESLESRRLMATQFLGRVVFDLGTNGAFNTGDPPSPGITVYLDYNGDYTRQVGEPGTVTDADGVFDFTVNLENNPGLTRDSRLRIERPAGYFITSELGPRVGNWSFFGLAPIANTISGVVFLDSNENGVQDVGEAGAADVLVQAYQPGSPLPFFRKCITDEQGRFFFDAPANQTFTVTLGNFWEDFSNPLYQAATDRSVSVTTDADGEGSALLGVKYKPTTVKVSVTQLLRPFPNLAGSRAADPGWTVYDDANDNGVLDVGESSAISNDTGLVQLQTTTGPRVLRLIPSPTMRSTPSDLEYREVVDGSLVQFYVYAQPNPMPYLPRDFNGDGLTDLVVRSSEPGRYQVRLMLDMRTLPGSNPLLLTTPDNNTDWTPSAIADFNSDGKPDIVWRRAATGQNVLHLLNGSTILQSINLPTIAAAEWKLRGGGDFDNDGDADLVWRRDTDGKATVWLMQNLALTGFAPLPWVSDLNWTLTDVADFNRDGHFDLLWQNATTVRQSIWLMNQNTVTTFRGFTTPLKPGWSFVGLIDSNGESAIDQYWAGPGGAVFWIMDNDDPGQPVRFTYPQ
jgi:hypothetical protein